MAWDIYGDRLEPGACEVHPWINEEYPCWQCRESQRAYEHQRECEAEQRRQHERDIVENVSGDGI